MEFLGPLLDIITNWYQFGAFITIAILILVKWFKIDPRKNKEILEAISRQEKETAKMIKSQNQLLSILIRRYSDNLTIEQIPPFITWLLQSLSFNAYHKFVTTKFDLDDNKISYEDSVKEMEQDIKLLFEDTRLTLKVFKFNGKPINKYCKNKIAEELIISAINELQKPLNIKRILINFDRTTENETLKLIENILSDEKNISN